MDSIWKNLLVGTPNQMLSEKNFQLIKPEEYEKKKKELEEFRSQLNENGYAYLECTKELQKIAESLQEESTKIFNTTKEEKQKNLNLNIEKENIRVSYTSSKLREMFDVHSTTDIFPNKEFEKTSKMAFEKCLEICFEYLEMLSHVLGFDFEYLKHLAGNPNDTETSLRLSHYLYSRKDTKTVCPGHCDSGIITLITCFNKGLHIKNFKNDKWIDVEKISPQKPCVILLVGETLSRLTAGYLKAPLHKVITDQERLAFTFFLRGDLTKQLEFKKMKSNFLLKNSDKEDEELFETCYMKDIDSRNPPKGKSYGYKFKETEYYKANDRK